jgi:hypothetical protein
MISSLIKDNDNDNDMAVADALSQLWKEDKAEWLKDKAELLKDKTDHKLENLYIKRAVLLQALLLSSA